MFTAHLSSSASLLCILKQPHHMFSESPVFHLSCYLWGFLCIQTIFLAVVAEILVGLPDRGLVSTEPLIFHFLIRVWTLLFVILNFLDIFLYPLPVLYRFNCLFLQILWQLFCFPHDSEMSVQHWIKDVRVCRESRNLFTFYTHTLITSKTITGEDGYL